MTSRHLLALMLLTAALPAAAQTAYRWVDKDGRVQYSDQPPPQEVKQFEERKVQPNKGNAQLPFATRKAAETYPVALYTGRECGKPCDDGRALLNQRGVPFSETKLETAEDVAAFKARFGKEPFVPTLTVGRETEMGFAASAWNGLLDNAGYPASKR
ncbi:DUF4124 domain-containing protein [uncultured Zoogloea sp.]|uniref:DUF4124 domain-containing protein n=1 Tax=uncultured Zoogloea sp. TaxID=160237 RepID=UPI002607634E|nr:DUF4124 domain-containing protein [uncultured Zoogloea sp.]